MPTVNLTSTCIWYVRTAYRYITHIKGIYLRILWPSRWSHINPGGPACIFKAKELKPPTDELLTDPCEHEPSSLSSALLACCFISNTSGQLSRKSQLVVYIWVADVTQMAEGGGGGGELEQSIHAPWKIDKTKLPIFPVSIFWFTAPRVASVKLNE